MLIKCGWRILLFIPYFFQILFILYEMRYKNCILFIKTFFHCSPTKSFSRHRHKREQCTSGKNGRQHSVDVIGNQYGCYPVTWFFQKLKHGILCCHCSIFTVADDIDSLSVFFHCCFGKPFLQAVHHLLGYGILSSIQNQQIRIQSLFDPAACITCFTCQLSPAFTENGLRQQNRRFIFRCTGRTGKKPRTGNSVFTHCVIQCMVNDRLCFLQQIPNHPEVLSRWNILPR